MTRLTRSRTQIFLRFNMSHLIISIVQFAWWCECRFVLVVNGLNHFATIGVRFCGRAQYFRQRIKIKTENKNANYETLHLNVLNGFVIDYVMGHKIGWYVAATASFVGQICAMVYFWTTNFVVFPLAKLRDRRLSEWNFHTTDDDNGARILWYQRKAIIILIYELHNSQYAMHGR